MKRTEIDKLFRAKDRMTTAEIRAQAEEPSFIETWEQKWAGKTRDKSKGAAANAGAPGMPKRCSTGHAEQKADHQPLWLNNPFHAVLQSLPLPVFWEGIFF